MVLSALMRRKARMFIALLAVAVGATIISGMVTVYREVPAQLGRAFRAYGANLLILPAEGQMEFDQSRMQEIQTTLKDYEVVGMAPFLYESVTINKQQAVAGGTDFAALREVSPYWQIEGKWPEKGEKEVLLGAEFAQQHRMTVGQEVAIAGGEGKAVGNYRVAGIVRTGGKEEQFAFLDLAGLQRLKEKPQRVTMAQISIVADGERLEAAIQAIGKGVPGIEPKLVKQLAHSEGTVLGKLQALVLLVTVVVLVLTLICVTTTQLAMVTERRKEIGLKKALGADNRHIIMEFLGEGCLLGFFGGLLGSGLGYLFAQSVSLNVFGRGLEFSPLIALLSLLLSIVITGLASLIPVRIATSVDPAIVLRGE